MVERNTAIDCIKGLLILLVVLGHLIKGSLDDSLPRFIIYAFHMPVFFFISGYLLDHVKLSKLSPKNLFLKYKKRMLSSWIVALTVYTLINSVGCFSLQHITYSILLPYYHLWFIPTLFSFFVIIYAVSRIVKSDNFLYVLLMTMALFLYISDVYYHVKLPLDIRTGYFIFLILGIIARKRCLTTKLNPIIVFLLGILLLIIVYGAVSHPREFFMQYLNLPFNIALCFFLVLTEINQVTWTNDTLKFIGEKSLFFYLWHVMPIMVLKKYLLDDYLYYSTAFCIMVITYSIIRNRERITKLICC